MIVKAKLIAKDSDEYKDLDEKTKEKLCYPPRYKKSASSADGRAKWGRDADKVVLIKKLKPWFYPSKLGSCGVSVAVNLLLQFQRECAGVFLLMLLFSIPSIIDNRDRNQLRNACRELTFDDNNYSSSAIPNITMACGWSDVRR